MPFILTNILEFHYSLQFLKNVWTHGILPLLIQFIIGYSEESGPIQVLIQHEYVDFLFAGVILGRVVAAVVILFIGLALGVASSSWYVSH